MILHFLVHYLMYLFKLKNERPSRHLSREGVVAYNFEERITQMGDLTYLNKDQIIGQLGVPNQTKVLKNGHTRLLWKGKKYKFEIIVDELGSFVTTVDYILDV